MFFYEVGFSLFSPLGEGFGSFWAQIRIPNEKLYVWSDGNVWKTPVESKNKDPPKKKKRAGYKICLSLFAQ